MTGDDIERVCICLRVLAERNPMMSAVFGERSREALASMLSAKETVKEEEKVWERRGKEWRLERKRGMEIRGLEIFIAHASKDSSFATFTDAIVSRYQFRTLKRLKSTQTMASCFSCCLELMSLWERTSSMLVCFRPREEGQGMDSPPKTWQFPN